MTRPVATTCRPASRRRGFIPGWFARCGRRRQRTGARGCSTRPVRRRPGLHCAPISTARGASMRYPPNSTGGNLLRPGGGRERRRGDPVGGDPVGGDPVGPAGNCRSHICPCGRGVERRRRAPAGRSFSSASPMPEYTPAPAGSGRLSMRRARLSLRLGFSPCSIAATGPARRWPRSALGSKA